MPGLDPTGHTGGGKAQMTGPSQAPHGRPGSGTHCAKYVPAGPSVVYRDAQSSCSEHSQPFRPRHEPATGPLVSTGKQPRNGCSAVHGPVPVWHA